MLPALLMGAVIACLIQMVSLNTLFRSLVNLISYGTEIRLPTHRQLDPHEHRHLGWLCCIRASPSRHTTRPQCTIDSSARGTRSQAESN